MSLNELQELGEALDDQRNAQQRLHDHWNGRPPAAFLSKKSRDALDGRLRTLSVNIPRLVVNSKVDRLSLIGFTGDSEQRAGQIWDDWIRAGGIGQSEMTHADYYLYGSAYVLVWPMSTGRPGPKAISARSCYADVDPGSGEVSAALRRWNHAGKSHAIVYTPETITRYSAPAPDFAPQWGGWATVKQEDNPLRTVPIVPFIRAQSSDDTRGQSAVADILDLTEALAKVLADAMVTSEHYARPRRWATGLEIEEDEDGRAVDPFGDSRFLQSEDPSTKFGQFDSVRLDGYTDLTATITQQIGSLTGLPPHYLGLHGDQPGSADGVRAAEAQMSSAAFSDQRALTAPWGRVAQLMAAIRNPGVDPTALGYTPAWGNPEIRTPAQAADAAVKEAGIGIPLRTILTRTLGYTPAEADEVVSAADSEQIMRAAGSLGRIAP